MRRLAAVGAGVLALAAASAPAAYADADPASDVLGLQNVFLPYRPAVSKPLADALTTVTARTRRAGFPLKVAVIASPNDLGAIPDLFGQPQRYATFLGQEIAFNGKQPLLVVMAAGVGTYAVPPAAAAAARAVTVPGSPSADDLARTALAAAGRMAKAAGHPVAVPQVAGGGGRAGAGPPAWVFAVPVLLLALAGFVLARRRQPDDDEHAPAEP